MKSSTRFLVLGLASRERLALIRRLLDPCGAVSVLRWVPWGPAKSPRQREVAQFALACAARPPSAGWRRRLRRWFYGVQYAGARALFERDPDLVAVCWNGLNGTRHAFMTAARDAGARTLFFELAPLPGRITVDPVGVNGRAGLPRGIEPYLEWTARHAPDPSRWRAAGAALRQRPGRPGVKPSSPLLPPLDEAFLFVPLQVPHDSQLRVFGGAFRSVESYLHVLLDHCEALPPGWHIRVKDHPSASTSVLDTVGRLRDHPRVVVDNRTDTFEQVARARAVFTVNSSVGLQAFFHDRPVVVSGDAFWAIDGLVDVARTSESLGRAIARPEALGFEPRWRDAFMSVLNDLYYPELPALDEPCTGSLERWRKAVDARLTTDWPPW